MKLPYPINAIVAVDSAGGIGKNNDLPWPRCKEDMKWFRENTAGGVIIMGKNTWLSLGEKKLPNRINIIVSNSYELGYDDPEVEVIAASIETILGVVGENYPEHKIWIIGGANLYEQAAPFVDFLYKTTFFDQYDCDAFLSKSYDRFNTVVGDHMVYDSFCMEILE